MAGSGLFKHYPGEAVGNGFSVVTYVQSSPLVYLLQHRCGTTQSVSHAKLKLAPPTCTFCRDEALRSQMSQNPTREYVNRRVQELDNSPCTDTPDPVPQAPQPTQPVKKRLSRRAAMMIGDACRGAVMTYEDAYEMFKDY